MRTKRLYCEVKYDYLLSIHFPATMLFCYLYKYPINLLHGNPDIRESIRRLPI